jgi:hypothetical protein
MTKSASLRPVQNSNMLNRYFPITTSQLTSLGAFKGEGQCRHYPAYWVLQIQKQGGNSAMLLASKIQHKEKTQNRNTQRKRLNTQKRTAGKHIEQTRTSEGDI